MIAVDSIYTGRACPYIPLRIPMARLPTLINWHWMWIRGTLAPWWEQSAWFWASILNFSSTFLKCQNCSYGREEDKKKKRCEMNDGQGYPFVPSTVEERRYQHRGELGTPKIWWSKQARKSLEELPDKELGLQHQSVKKLNLTMFSDATEWTKGAVGVW